MKFVCGSAMNKTVHTFFRENVKLYREEMEIYVSAFYGPILRRAVDKACIFVGSRVCV